MIRNCIILSISILALIAPGLAFASSPWVDTFDSGISAWTEATDMPAWTGTNSWRGFSWDTNEDDCYNIYCVVESGNGTPFATYAQGVSLNEGSFVVYFRNDGFTGPVAVGVCVYGSDTTNDCGGGISIPGDEGLIGDAGSNLENNNTWNYIYFAFEDGPGSTKQTCTMVNDDNDGDCSWVSSLVANGTQEDTVYLTTEAGMDASASFYWDELGDTTFTPPDNSRTYIQSVTPTGGAVVSTGDNTFGATGYVTSQDFTSGMTVTMKYNNNVGLCNSSLPFLPCTATTITFPITSSGAFDFSTTSPTTLKGNYTMSTNITGAQSINFFGFSVPLPLLSNTYTSTTTSFLVGSATGFDNLQSSTTDSISALLASSSVDLSSCDSLTAFNLTNCMSILFLPQGSVLFGIYSNFQSTILQDFPWGYVTRFVTILDSTGTSTIPSASVTIWMPYSEGGGADASNTLTIDPTGTLADASAALNGVDANGTDLNWEGVLEPYIQLFIAISILFIIIHDLIGTAHHYRNNSPKGGRKGGKLS